MHVVDISKWTNEERVKLPDFVFGSRELSSVYVYNAGGSVFAWGISDYPLPDKAVIWTLSFQVTTADANGTYIRFGIRDTVPTSQAEMNTAIEITPFFGTPQTGPNIFVLYTGAAGQMHVTLRRPMTTGGKKLVVETKKNGLESRTLVWITTSPLPNNIAGWLLDSFLKNVR